MSLAAVPTRSVTAAGKAASTPFGASQAFSKQQLSCRPCQSSASAAMQRMASVDMAMARSFSGSAPLQRARSRATHTTPALSALAEHGGFLDLLSNPSAATASFDDVCEMLGDVAKIDGVTSALTAGVKNLGNNPIINWVMEKAAGNVQAITQITLLEGLVDKTLIDLFQQLYGVLDLDGAISSNWVVRLGAAAAIAFVVRQLVHQYQHQNPNQLQRLMSPAASLSDAIADSAAAALIANTVKSSSNSISSITGGLSLSISRTLSRGLSRSLSMADNASLQLATAAGALPIPAGVTIPSSTSSNPSNVGPARSSSPASQKSKFQQVTSKLLKDSQLPAAAKARVAAQSLLASVFLGQYKRANKLKRKVKLSASEIAEGRWSPGMLLVMIEAGVLVHNYSELMNGVSAIMGMGS